MGSRMATIYKKKKKLVGNFYYVEHYSIINKFINNFKYKKIQH